MKKKLDVMELAVGMYVAELDRPWLESPFVFQGFFLYSEDEVAQIRSVCKYVYVDTQKTEEISSEFYGSETENHDHLNGGIGLHSVSESTTESFPGPTVSFEDEYRQAHSVYGRLHELIYDLYFDIRMGDSINVGRCRELVHDLTASILRNPDTQIWLARLYTKGEAVAAHSSTVAVFSLVFGAYLRLNIEQLIELGTGALLHDIGLLKVSQDVINKPGKLTPAEYQSVQSHALHGRDLLRASQSVSDDVIAIAYSHHEAVDGSGYPQRLVGEEIPLYARIVSIVDSYDAMTSRRSYRETISPFAALQELYDLRDRRYEASLVQKFIQCLGIYPVGSLVELYSGEVGVVMSNHKSRRLQPAVLLVMDAGKRYLSVPRVVDLKSDNAAGRKEHSVKCVLSSTAYGIDVSRYMEIDKWFK